MHLGEKLKAYKKQNDKDQKEMADLQYFDILPAVIRKRIGMVPSFLG